MVALEVCANSASAASPKEPSVEDNSENIKANFVSVTNDNGEIIAYVPGDMGVDCAWAHATLIGQAEILRKLTLFAAAEISQDSHPGLLREFRGRCQTVLDRIDDAITIG